MYHRIMAILSPLLLAALALPVAVAPQALAAPLQPAAIAAPLLFPQTQQDEYTRGFRDGFRKGHDDGEVDGQLECKQNPRPRPFVQTTPTDYDRGFSDGYPRGYQSGFERFCGGRSWLFVDMQPLFAQECELHILYKCHAGEDRQGYGGAYRALRGYISYNAR
jgi:hypothetical protein